MNTKHTPGPWVAIYPEQRHSYELNDITAYEVLTANTRKQLSDEGLTHYRPDPSGVDNISVVGMTFWKDMLDEEAKANAILIAAAPDLLDALKKCEHALVKATPVKDEDPELQATAIFAASTAIAKATGETS
jgi:hypothetical protein